MADFSKQKEKTAALVKKVGDRAVVLQNSSTQHVDKYVKKRASRIIGIRRFVAGWLVLVVLLCVSTLLATIRVYQASQISTGTPGGVYTEGAVGRVNNLNPLFGSGAIDESIGKLVFNGLARYDTTGTLVPDLAEGWQVTDEGKTYTVTLRDDVRWHDGKPLTAEDVVFTIKTIQNPQTRSILFASWQGVTVTAKSEREIVFSLPAAFAPFPNALTQLIVPKHLLNDIPVEKLRTASFNSTPIGTGPFLFATLRNDVPKEQQVELRKNTDYYRGTPKIDRFVLHGYEDDEALFQALSRREITAAVDLKGELLANFENDTSIRVADIPLNSGVFAFFKTSQSALSDNNVRLALAEAVDRQAVLSLFSARYAPLKTPLLPSQLGFDVASQQKTDIAAAAAKLDAAGWVKDEDGIRTKDGVPLELNMTTLSNPQYSLLAAELQKQWAALGVLVKPQLLNPEQLQQNALSAHAYDILLYGISIGADPDVYAYWHSSQARSGGLNFSEWKSARADVSLEVARTRLDPVLRDARYKNFQDEWAKSAPAIALYQPRVSYAYHQNATGFMVFPLSHASERLTNVEEWTVNTRLVERTP